MSFTPPRRGCRSWSSLKDHIVARPSKDPITPIINAFSSYISLRSSIVQGIFQDPDFAITNTTCNACHFDISWLYLRLLLISLSLSEHMETYQFLAIPYLPPYFAPSHGLDLVILRPRTHRHNVSFHEPLEVSVCPIFPILPIVCICAQRRIVLRVFPRFSGEP